MSDPDKIPVLLDTDIGNDIDDAVCLAYLLKQARCELVGVTTATGDTLKRACLAGAVCDAAGRGQVPIHAGAPGPLLTGPGQPEVPQYAALEGRPHRKEFPTDGVEYLRRTIRERPGEITLLAIGPLTNVALLFALDPEIPSMLKRLVLMCGVFAQAGGHAPNSREWNARSDPVATAMVFRARPPEFLSVGLDVTTQCRLSAAECRERFTEIGGPLSVVAELTDVWAGKHGDITFHDPLAGALIFEPDLCGYREGHVTVETDSPSSRGLTTFDPDGKETPHRIAVSVDPSRFFSHYFDIVSCVVRG